MGKLSGTIAHWTILLKGRFRCIARISMAPMNPNAIPQPTGVTLINVSTNVGPSMGP